MQMGGVFGPEKSNKWMISFITSFFESLLLSQPIKVGGRKVIGHVNEYPTMHQFGSPEHTQSIIAYVILT